MAGEKIDELLVGLRLEQDRQSFQQAESSFANLRRGALQFTAVIGGGLGFDQLTRGVANANDQLGLTSQQLGVTTRDLDSLQFAFERSGGSAEDAVSSMRAANTALDELALGSSPAFDMASMWNLDVTPLMEASDAMEFMLRLSEQLDGRSTTQQRNILDTFGLGGEGTFELLTGGRNELENVLGQAQELSPTLGTLVDSSREFNESLAELTRSVEGITNIIGEDLITDLTLFADAVSAWLTENRDLVTSVLQFDPAEAGAAGADWIKDGLADLIGDVEIRRGQGRDSERLSDILSRDAIMSAISVSIPDIELRRGQGRESTTFGELTNSQRNAANVRNNDAMRAAVAQAERDIGAPEGLLWAQIGQESNYDPTAFSDAGARGLAQIMPDTERSLEKRAGRDFDAFDPSDSIEMQSMLMRENFENSGNWEEALRLYHGGYDRSQWGPVNEAYAPAIQERMGVSGGNTTQKNTFNISGSDPQQNAREVEKILRRTADQARQDTANEVY